MFSFLQECVKYYKFQKKGTAKIYNYIRIRIRMLILGSCNIIFQEKLFQVRLTMDYNNNNNNIAWVYRHVKFSNSPLTDIQYKNKYILLEKFPTIDFFTKLKDDNNLNSIFVEGCFELQLVDAVYVSSFRYNTVFFPYHIFFLYIFYIIYI